MSVVGTKRTCYSRCRKVLANFGGGILSSDAGALGAADRAIGLVDRFARCFHDLIMRHQDLIEQEVLTLIAMNMRAKSR